MAFPSRKRQKSIFGVLTVFEVRLLAHEQEPRITYRIPLRDEFVCDVIDHDPVAQEAIEVVAQLIAAGVVLRERQRRGASGIEPKLILSSMMLSQ